MPLEPARESLLPVRQAAGAPRREGALTPRKVEKSKKQNKTCLSVSFVSVLDGISFDV